MFTIGEWKVKVRLGTNSQTVNVRPIGAPDGEHVWVIRMRAPNFVEEERLKGREFHTIEQLVEYLQAQHAGVVERSPRTGVRVLNRRAPEVTVTTPTLTHLDLVNAVDGPTADFLPARGGSLSTLFGWTADSGRLCVTASERTKKFQQLDLSMAHALGHLCDRDLWIIAPRAYALVVADRAAFLDVPIKVWGTANGEVGPVEIPRPKDVLTKYAETTLGERDHDLGRASEWLAPLVAWAEQRGLVPQVLNGYRSWHFLGRQVLKVTANTAGTRLRVVAGTDYEEGRGKPEATRKPIAGPLDRATLESLISAAERSINARIDGRDAENLEHELQERLVEYSNWSKLGLVHGHEARELRTLWPDALRRNGFIDLLGVDAYGTIRVIETKIGPDPRLVLQALDYWIWAKANIDLVAANLGLSAAHRVAIDFVVAEKQVGRGVIGSYTAAQAEAMAGAVPWRFTTVREWRDGAPEIHRLPSRTLPTAARGRATLRKTEPRWAIRVQERVTAHAASIGHELERGSYWPDRADGLLPAGLDALEVLTTSHLDHEHVGHVRSSQAFALNLFAPLDSHALLAICREMGIDATSVERPAFEFSDAADHLAEATHASRHKTQVDVLLRARTSVGTTHTALIEVKLTEPDFNWCSAWLSDNNDSLDACTTPGPFGNDNERCFQLRNKGREHRRQYDVWLAPLPAQDRSDDSTGCWFRTANQPMRNVALARVLVTTGQADLVTVALCAPLGHASMWRRWSEAKSHLAGLAGVNLVDLPADKVAVHHPDRAELAGRYLLTPER